MPSGQFRFAYFTPLYEETVAFYRDGLDLPVVEAGTAHQKIEAQSSAPLPA